MGLESIYTPEYVPHFALFHATLTYVVKGKYTTARRSGLGPRPLGRAVRYGLGTTEPVSVHAHVGNAETVFMITQAGTQRVTLHP